MFNAIAAKAMADYTVALGSIQQVATGTDILSGILNKLKGGIGFLGGAMIVIGAVIIGINVRDATGNGGAIASGVATLVGGVIIVAASVYFSSLDTSWIEG